VPHPVKENSAWGLRCEKGSRTSLKTGAKFVQGNFADWGKGKKGTGNFGVGSGVGGWGGGGGGGGLWEGGVWGLGGGGGGGVVGGVLGGLFFLGYG